MSQGNSVLYNERRAVILPPKMPLWHADYFEIQLHKKWMMKQGNIKDMQKLFGKQIHQTVFIKIFDNFTCLCSTLLLAKLLEVACLLNRDKDMNFKDHTRSKDNLKCLPQ